MTFQELKEQIMELLTDELQGFANTHPWLQPAVGRSINRTRRLLERYEKTIQGEGDVPVPPRGQ